jgi:lipopolysaccharide transport system permease protein
MALQILFTYGLGLLAATLSVFFRDLTHAIPILMQVWFWLSPVVYPESILPAGLLGWMRLNPIAWLLHVYRDLLLDARMPDTLELALFAGLALLLSSLGTVAYHRLKGEIADEV